MGTRTALAAALLVGLLVRVPGVFWGWNFPTGWYGHHVDEYTHLVYAEMLINPTLPQRWPPHPYSRGLAAHVAVPLLAVEAVRGRLGDGLPSPQTIIVTGRVVSVLYGVATILLVFLLARRLLRPSAPAQSPEATLRAERVAVLAAWFIALGGLHVSQSHFFTSDVPALFWLLLGSYALYRDVEERSPRNGILLAAAAFCFGVAFGLKLVLAALPSLGIAVLLAAPRVYRIVTSTAMFVTGFVVVNVNSFTTLDFVKTATRSATEEFSRMFGLLLYAIQLPALMSLPLLLLAIAGTWMLMKKVSALEPGRRRTAVWLAVILPQAVTALMVIFTLDNFLRHLIPFIPWLAIAAAYALFRVMEWAQARRLRPALVAAPVLLYLAVFVADGERFYIDEPRNDAAKWLLANVPQGSVIWWQGHNLITQYQHANYTRQGRPPIVLIEMHRANEVLSGMGWKNSMPDHRHAFGERPQSEVEALQGLFKGTTEYREVARFPERYRMPEFRLADSLLGNRSRNYLAEVVVFRRDDALSSAVGPR
jgi:hypothetical protein